MENQLTETEAIVRMNSLKDKHELLKMEILNLLDSVDIKQKELALVEEEYAKMIEILLK